MYGVLGYLLYARRSRHEQRLAILGSILPDVFLVLGFVAHYGAIVTQAPLVEALHNFLHHSALHTVTVSMHSFVIVALCLALSAALYKPAMPFFVGMLAHGIVDLLTHRHGTISSIPPTPPSWNWAKRAGPSFSAAISGCANSAGRFTKGSTSSRIGIARMIAFSLADV
jgi:hypothetical protein